MNKYLQGVKLIIVDQFACDPSDVTPEAMLEGDFDWDELDKIEILMRLEEDYSLEILDEEAEKWETVSDIADYIERRIEERTVELAPQKRKPTHPWVIRINDGFCEYEYELGSRNGNMSVNDVYQAVRTLLDAEEQNGTFIKYGT